MSQVAIMQVKASSQEVCFSGKGMKEEDCLDAECRENSKDNEM